MQKVLICSTSSTSMKAEIWGYSTYNSDCVKLAADAYPDKNIWSDTNYIGFINASIYLVKNPITPLHALALGWKLLAPPSYKGTIDNKGTVEFEWWFTKE